ncbi:hypothetical protein VPH35_081139 [Triticum aestivum]
MLWMLASRHVVELLRHCRSIRHLDQLHAHLLAHGSSGVAPLASQLALPTARSQVLLDTADSSAPVTCSTEFLTRTGSCTKALSGRAPIAVDPKRRSVYTGTSSGAESYPTCSRFRSCSKACVRAQAAEHVLPADGVLVNLGYVRQMIMRNTLLHSYVSTGSLRDSWLFFSEIAPDRTQAGETGEACTLFGEMGCQGVLSDEITSACFVCERGKS